jgi:antitoxin MazE
MFIMGCQMSHVVKAKIQRWGNGLGLRVAGLIRDIPRFMPDTEVEVEVFDDGFRVRKTKPALFSFPYSEAELLNNLSLETAQVGLLAQPDPIEVKN